jgi:hypothetical protein
MMYHNAALLLLTAAAAAPSIHFGCAGELWNASQRLPADWSFAGYASGDTPIPDVPVVGNVRDYGAVGDNKTDDTDAFLRALADPKVPTPLVGDAVTTVEIQQRVTWSSSDSSSLLLLRDCRHATHTSNGLVLCDFAEHLCCRRL